MKKAWAILLTLILAIGVFGCGEDELIEVDGGVDMSSLPDVGTIPSPDVVTPPIPPNCNVDQDCPPNCECKEGVCACNCEGDVCQAQGGLGAFCEDDSDCESGICYAPFCSRQCKSDTECKQILDKSCSSDGECPATEPLCRGGKCVGYVGTQFSCMAGDSHARQGLCWPGSLTPCSNNDHCSNGEVCGVGVSQDGLRTAGWCMAPIEGGAQPGEYCDMSEDDFDVEMTQCAAPGIYTGDRYIFPACDMNSCLAACVTDDDCKAPGTYCENLGGAGFCYGKVCKSQADCGGKESDWVCSGAYSNVAQTAIEGRCIRRDPSKAGIGEDCNDWDDSVEDVACGTTLCIGSEDEYGKCTIFCETTADCDSLFCTDLESCDPSLKEAICMDIGFMTGCSEDDDCDEGQSCCFDPEDPEADGYCCWDGNPDAAAIFDYTGTCMFGSPGSHESCATDQDCSVDGEGCTPAIRAGELQGYCVNAGESQIGGVCDFSGAPERSCYNSFCLMYVGYEEGTCSSMCATTQDCPVDFVCGGVLMSYGDDGVSGGGDDLLVGSCMESPGTAHPPCTFDSDRETGLCPAGSVCQVFALVYTDDASETYCSAPLGSKPVGNECGSDLECSSGMCLKSGQAKGYCSVPCRTSVDCAPADGRMSCRSFYDVRGDITGLASDKLNVSVCSLTEPCSPCADDGQCLSGSCLDLSNGNKTLFGCGKSCSDDNDCTSLGDYKCAMSASEGIYDSKGNIVIGQCYPRSKSCDDI